MTVSRHLCRSGLFLLFFAAGALLHAAGDAQSGTSADQGQGKGADHVAGPDQSAVTDEQYHLVSRDTIKVIVQGESDVSVERRIDGRGEINVPLLGQIKVAGLTVVEVQDLIAKRYVDAEIFVHPEVVVSVTDYSPRDVVILGQVANPGKIAFPPEATAMPIVDAIASAGGFTRLANQASVRVTRKDDNGQDQTTTLNVEKMIDGHSGSNDNEMFMVQPGDVVYVPERLL